MPGPGEVGHETWPQDSDVQMPALGRALRPEDLHDVAAYILAEISE